MPTAARNGGPNDRELTASSPPPARWKTWAEVTDEEIIEAVRFGQERTNGGAAYSVEAMLSQPSAEQWATQPPPANAYLGLGLIPPWGEGSAPRGSVTRRLKKLAEQGRVVAVELCTKNGKRVGYAWKLPPCR